MDNENPLAPARGCMYGVLFSIPLWAVLILALYLLGWLPWQ